jgi:ABC-2 type transport system permease protein
MMAKLNVKLNITRLIAARDLTEFVRDGRLLWAGSLVVILLLTALAVNWQSQRSATAERVAAQAFDYDGWVSQDQRHPHDAAHQGMNVFKPAPPLSIIDPGIDPYVGSTIWLQAHRQSEVKFRPAQDATGLQRFGNLSVAWVLQVLGPLLVIVLGFNAFAGEREQGTLRQSMSLGVASRQLLWGKALALVAGLAALLVPCGLIAAVMSVFGLPGARWGDALLRLAVLALAYAIYFGIAIFIVLAVSAKASSSRVALVVLLTLWIAGVTLAPRAVSDLSRQWYPSPTRLAFGKALDTDLSAQYERVWQQNFGVKSRWGTELPLNKWGKALQVDDHAGYGVIDQHFSQLWTTFAQQRRAQEWAGLVVPLLALRSFSMGMAGTDFANHQAFSIAAENQRRVLQDLMSHNLVEHADPLGNQHFVYKAGPELWKTVPRFNYELPDTASALQQNWRSLAILLAGLCVAACIAVAATRRLINKVQ